MTDLFRRICDEGMPHRNPLMGGGCDETCFVPAVKVGSLSVNDDGFIAITNKELAEGFYTIVEGEEEQ